MADRSLVLDRIDATTGLAVRTGASSMSQRDADDILRPDPDFQRAKRALARGWITRDQIERAILREDENPRSNLLSFLPLSPEQISTLDGHLPADVAQAMTDASRSRGRYWLVDLLRNERTRFIYRGWDLKRRCWVILESPKQWEFERSVLCRPRPPGRTSIPACKVRIAVCPGTSGSKLRLAVDRVFRSTQLRPLRARGSLGRPGPR
jgi:hypothetical protein